jgi:glutamate--cysteine ligase
MSEAASPVLENTTHLKEWMAAGCKPREAWRIGTEHEKFGYRKSDFAPLPYDGPDGIKAMLEGLMQFGWEGKYEGDTLVGLGRSAEAGGGSVTLEPAGQLELSGAPLETIHQTCAEISAHMSQVHDVAARLGQGYFGVGYTPFWNFDTAPRMPKGRYRLMTDYMPKQGGRGTEMMYLTATVQVNLDFASEADMVEKLRIALALQPLATGFICQFAVY